MCCSQNLCSLMGTFHLQHLAPSLFIDFGRTSKQQHTPILIRFKASLHSAYALVFSAPIMPVGPPKTSASAGQGAPLVNRRSEYEEAPRREEPKNHG